MEIFQGAPNSKLGFLKTQIPTQHWFWLRLGIFHSILFGIVPKQNGVWLPNDIEDTKSQVVWHVGFLLCIEPLQPNTQPRQKSLLGMKRKATFKYHLFLYAPGVICARAVREKKKQTMLLYCLQ